MRSFHRTAEYHELFMTGPWERLMPRLVGALGGTDPRHVLELGAGSGMGTLALADAWPQARITCVEPDPMMRAMLMGRLAADPSLRSRVEVLPMAVSPAGLEALTTLVVGAGEAGGDPSVDLVVGAHLLGMLREDERAAFYELSRRVLAPGGVVALTCSQPHARVGGDGPQEEHDDEHDEVHEREIALGAQTVQERFAPESLTFTHRAAGGGTLRRVEVPRVVGRAPLEAGTVIAEAGRHGLRLRSRDEEGLVVLERAGDVGDVDDIDEVDEVARAPLSVFGDRIEAVTAAHTARLQGVDPVLGAAAVPPWQDAAGTFVEQDLLGTWLRREVTEEDQISLWGGLTQDILVLRSAEPIGDPGLGDLLDRVEVARTCRPVAGESELVVRLPVAESDAVPVLLSHGFRPSATTAVLDLTVGAGRVGADSVAAPPGVTIRDAEEADRPALLDLLEQMHRSDITWGCGYDRPTLSRHLGDLADEAIARHGWTWVAELDGRVVGVLSLQSAQDAAWAGASLAEPDFVYVGLTAVDGAARRGGIGTALVERAHRRGREAGARVALLDHAALSPLSSTFWHRRGYRPLWTTWVRTG